MWSWLGDFNEGDLLFLGGWGKTLIVVMAVLACVVLVLSYLDLRSMQPRKRAWILLSLRAFVLAMGVIFLLEPTLELRDVDRIKNHVVFLMDGSRSMEVEVSSGKTRRERGADAVGMFEGLSTSNKEHVFDFYLFGEELERSSVSGLASNVLAGGRDGTRIRTALEGVRANYGRNQLGGVVLISDGIDSGILGGRNPRDLEVLDSETQTFLSSLEAPVHVLAVSPTADFKDVAIEEVLHDDFAFVRNRIAIDVNVRALGYEGSGAQVELWQDGVMLRSRPLSFTEANTRETVTFEWVPERLGKTAFTVRVPELEGEALVENNEYHFILKVIRDKIRVLQVAGRPSWDERFLRRLLKENPNVDLISFFILRTPADLNLASQSELSLIPFPKDELFDKELRSFDLVIFQDFNFGPYVRRIYLNRVEEFVREGGGFAMVGGELSFSGGGYAGTPLGDVLPVELYPASDAAGLLSTSDFAMELTPSGRRHPIMKLVFDAAENVVAWGEMPKLQGINYVRKARPGATVLGVHPTLDAEQGKMPVVAVWDYQKGRAMAFTTDTSWMWGFDAVGQGGTARGYSNFWNNAIRWLIKDPELKLIKVETESDELRPGETVRATVRVLRPDYTPDAGVKGKVGWVRRELKPPYAMEDVEELSFVTDERGSFVFERTVEELGAYTVQAWVDREESRIEDDDIFLVTQTSPEHREVVPRNALLREIAKHSGGSYIELPSQPEVLGSLPFEAPKVSKVNKRSLYALWDVWWVFVVLSLALVGEWLLRRRWGRL